MHQQHPQPQPAAAEPRLLDAYLLQQFRSQGHQDHHAYPRQEFIMRYLSSSAHAAERRPGVVLLVVMAMLALFASLALSFVFYADAEATSTQLAMQSQVKPVADVDPETLAAYFLGQLLYDSNNTESQLRGWSLARSIYGYNPA